MPTARNCRSIAARTSRAWVLPRRLMRRPGCASASCSATASAGPGTSNLLTSAALAHANRLPLLLLCGDAFVTRLPDPVLQQMEHFDDPTLGVNDAFKAVTRYWDRITHPAQVIQSLPAAIATMLDPADCGPAFLALPQDVQGWSYDYPESVLRKKGAPHPPPDARCGRDRRCRGAAEGRQAADDHRRRRGAVFPRGGRTHGLCRGAPDPGGRNHRRASQLGGHPSAQYRPGRRDRFGQRQCHRRKGRRDPRRRHTVAGFHHRVLDGFRQGRALCLDQRRTSRCGQAYVGPGGGRRKARAHRPGRGRRGYRAPDEWVANAQDAQGVGRLCRAHCRPGQPAPIPMPRPSAW